jgi:hypothetical protein
MLIRRFRGMGEIARAIADLERALQALEGKATVRQIRIYTSDASPGRRGSWRRGRLAPSTGFEGAQMQRRLFALAGCCCPRRPRGRCEVGAGPRAVQETFVVQGEPERRDTDRLVWNLDVRPV